MGLKLYKEGFSYFKDGYASAISLGNVYHSGGYPAVI